MSLNNRISTRDMNETRGVVIDRQVVAVSDFACSEGTGDTIILEVVKPREDLMKQPATETEVEECAKGESCDRHIILLLFYASLDCRRCVMPIIASYTNLWCCLWFMVCKSTDALNQKSLICSSIVISVQLFRCM